MENEKKVSIILVNYNGYEDTVECVKSILTCDYTNYDIYIVENGSRDKENIKEDIFLNEHCIVIYSEKNGGFSEGNNIGIEASLKSNPDYVLLLNNDTVVTPTFLNELVCVAEENKQCTIVTSTINYYYDKEKHWYSYGTYNKLLGYTSMPSSDTKHTKPFSVSFATGCLMLIRTEFIRKYGMLSEDYFLYSEDTEYCLRVLEKGYTILSVPKVLIYHKVNASTGTGSLMQQYYLTRNYLIVAKQYGTCFPLAYLFRFALSMYEVVRYHYDFKTVLLAFKDYRKGIKGKVDYFN